MHCSQRWACWSDDVIYDLTIRGKLHPVTLWGVAFIVISEPLRFVIGFSASWQAFARALMG